MIELSNDDIMLRPFELSDSQEHLDGEDEEQIKWLSGGKGTLEGVEKWILRNKYSWEYEGPILNFAIVDKKDNKLAGMVEANVDYENIEGIEKGDANISYGLYPRARGKGYASQAVLLLIPLLKNYGLKRAVIRVDHDNQPSLSVPLRLAFTETGMIKTKDGKQLKLFVRSL